MKKVFLAVLLVGSLLSLKVNAQTQSSRQIVGPSLAYNAPIVTRGDVNVEIRKTLGVAGALAIVLLSFYAGIKLTGGSVIK